MSGPLLLDLFWGAGGAGRGYPRAGFEFIGVDLRPMPRSPFRFVQADAVRSLETWDLSRFAAVHASPPCQAYSQMTTCRPGLASEYPELVDEVRALLEGIGVPWAMENVGGS